MAIIDPTLLARARNLFPEFTDKQFEVLVFFSAGYSRDFIADELIMSKQSFYNALKECRRILSVDNNDTLKCTFFIRMQLSALPLAVSCVPS